MKKIQLSFLLSILLIFNSEGQIALEEASINHPNEYTGIMNWNVGEGEILFTKCDQKGVDRKITIYNSDLSVYKEVSLPFIPGDFNNQTVSVISLSRTAVNTDSDLEMIVNYTQYKGGGTVLRTYIVNESGTLLQTIENINFYGKGEASIYQPFFQTSNGLKILGSQIKPSNKTILYSLPGYYNERPPVLLPDPIPSTPATPENQGTEQNSIYPNPVENSFTIELKSGEVIPKNSTLRLFTPEGRAVIKMVNPIESKTVKMDVSNLETGLYLFQLTDPSSKKIADGRLSKK